MTPLDLILAGCLVVLAAAAVLTPTKCSHPCAACGAEAAERRRRDDEMRAKGRAANDRYAHEQGIDRVLCSLCDSYHCHHDGCG